MATLCRELCQIHPRLRPDLLIAAALVHDVGRTRELGPPPVFAPTEQGRLLGHVHLGLRLLEELDAPDELLHAVACHHDARAARTAEAAVLYHANQLDAVAATRPVHGLIGVVLALAASLSWGIADFGGGLGARRAQLVWVLARLPGRGARARRGDVSRDAARRRRRAASSPGACSPA